MKFYYDNIWAALYMHDVFGVKFVVDPCEEDEDACGCLGVQPAPYPLENVSVFTECDLSSAIGEIEEAIGGRKIYVAEESLGVFNIQLHDEWVARFDKGPEVCSERLIHHRNGKSFIMPKREE